MNLNSRSRKIVVGSTFGREVCPIPVYYVYHCGYLYPEWNIKLGRKTVVICSRSGKKEEFSFKVDCGLIHGTKILFKLTEVSPYFNTSKLQMKDDPCNSSFCIENTSVNLCDTLAVEIKRETAGKMARADCDKCEIELFPIDKKQINDLFSKYLEYINKCSPPTISAEEKSSSLAASTFYGDAGVQPINKMLKPSDNNLIWVNQNANHDSLPSNKKNGRSRAGSKIKENNVIDISKEPEDLEPYFASSPKMSRTNYAAKSSDNEPKSKHEQNKNYIKSTFVKSPLAGRNTPSKIPRKRTPTKPSIFLNEQSPKLSFTVNSKSEYQKLLEIKSKKTDKQLAANPIEISDDEMIEAKPSNPKPTDYSNFSQSPRGTRSSTRNAIKESLEYAPRYPLITMPAFVRNYNLDDVICVRMGVQLKKDDVMRLDSGEFLNDQIILYFIKYYESEFPNTDVHVFSSFFYYKLQQLLKSKSSLDPLLKWHKTIDIFKYPIIIIPINESLHWYFIVITNIQELKKAITERQEGDLGYIVSQIVIVDSLHSTVRPAVKGNIGRYLAFLLGEPDYQNVVKPYVEMRMGHSPLQPNGCDCGIFMVYGIKMILENSEIVTKILDKEKKDWWGGLLERQLMLTIITDHHDAYAKEHGSSHMKNKMEIDDDDDEILCIDEKYTKRTSQDDFIM